MNDKLAFLLGDAWERAVLGCQLGGIGPTQRVKLKNGLVVALRFEAAPVEEGGEVMQGVMKVQFAREGKAGPGDVEIEVCRVRLPKGDWEFAREFEYEAGGKVFQVVIFEVKVDFEKVERGEYD